MYYFKNPKKPNLYEKDRRLWTLNEIWVVRFEQTLILFLHNKIM